MPAARDDHKDTYRRIGVSTAIIIALTIADKAFALVKEMVVANRYGVSPDLDVFNIAYGFPGIVVMLLTGAVVSAFVPLYVSLGKTPEGKTVRDGVMTLVYASSAFFILLYALCWLTAPYYFPLLGYGFSPEQQTMGAAMERVLILLILVEGIGVVFSGLLQAEKDFANLYIAPLFVNAALIVFLFAGRELGIYAMVWGFVVGTSLKVLYMILACRRFGFRLFAGFRFDGETLRTLTVLALPLVGSALIVNSSIMIDQVMATELSHGGVSALRYAYRINDLPLQVLVLAMSEALLPYISRQAFERDFAGMRYIFKNSMIFLGLVSLPSIAFVMLFADDIVFVLLQRGAFDADAAKLTAATLRCYSLGLFFHAYTFINGAFFTAMKKNTTLLYMGVLAMALNVAFNFLFIHLYGDVRGIAMSTTVSMGLISLLFIVLLQRILKTDFSLDYLKSVAVIGLASLAVYAGGSLVRAEAAARGVSVYLYFPALAVLLVLVGLGLLYVFRTKDLEDCVRTLLTRRRA